MAGKNKADKMSAISNVSRQVYGSGGRRQDDAFTFSTDGGERRERLPDSRYMPLPESKGCTRDGHIRAWRA